MRLTTSPDSNKSLTKRTRVVGSQSKLGCFTCNPFARDADGQRSSVKVILLGRILIQGIRLSLLGRHQTHPKTHLDIVSTKDIQPTFAPLDGFRRSPTQDRLARLGCSVLRDGLHDQFEVSRTVFESLLPQLSHALPSVNAAAAALGAVYEMQTAPLETVDSKRLLVVTQYGVAIREVQHELVNRPYGAVPILVACVLLACVDVLLVRMRLALLHVRGAMRLLEERNAMSTLTPVSRPVGLLAGADDGLTSGTDSLPREEEDDDLTVFFRMLDVQTVSYADGLPPEMHPALVETSQVTASSSPCVHRKGRELIALIQACFCFTSYASRYIHRPQIFAPANLTIDQGRHIAALRLWLRQLDHELLPSIKASTIAASSKYTHCLLLRNLCLSAIIYASNILCPYQTRWDAYGREFREIVTGAESILANRRRTKPRVPSSPTSAFTFTPSPGIIQPLYLTVLKYRHPTWRRKALELLRQSDKEGPWDGRLMAAAAQRVIQIEESELGGVRASSVRVEQGLGKEDAEEMDLGLIVPERIRICGSGPDNGPDGEGAFDWDWMKEWEYTSNQDAMRRQNVARVRFARCRDIDRMLAAGLHYQPTDNDPAWLEEHWERWTETVKL